MSRAAGHDPRVRSQSAPARAESVRTAYVESLGCASNLADTRAVQDQLCELGWQLVERPDDARVRVVMTCGFTGQMEARNRARIAELAFPPNEEGHLFVGGCLPAILAARLPLPSNATAFGPRSMEKFRDRLEALSFDGVRRLGRRAETGTPVPVRVATGCRSHCSFCIIPRAAGSTRSRTPADVLEELGHLYRQGIDAVELTAEDFSAYGGDLGLSYVDLLRTVLEQGPPLRLLLGSLNPKWLGRHLTETLELLRNPRIDRRLYVPIQSGSSDVLRRMARGYDAETVERVLGALATVVPNLSIHTDFLVGSPGESDEEFEATRALVRRHSFAFAEVFAFTERVGTSAARAPGAVPPEERRRRARILMADLLERELARDGVVDSSSLEARLGAARSLAVNTNVPWSEPA